MKQIIEGLVYDTEKAELLAEWSNGYRASDFKHEREKLYRTAKGRYFIAGVGGPMSAYSEPCGDATTGGSQIRPLDEEEAKSWARANLSAGEALALFPDCAEEA